MSPMKIAIIGSGISGLGAAYLFNQEHDITLYEKNVSLGGHSRTIDVAITDHDKQAVDTGFIVFNKKNYPHLVGLFDHLSIAYEESDMSFGASINDGWLEYGSKGIFSQKRNLFRRSFWKMLFDILKFNRNAVSYLEKNQQAPLEEFLQTLNLGDWFRRYYLQAMGAAIWSCSVETILKFPARTFIRFFDNHGLLTINSHPQWYTVTGGSREYVEKISSKFSDRIRKNCAVHSVTRTENGRVTVLDSKGIETEFDHVIFACHADQALRMITNPSKEETSVLQAFSYQKNKVVVHRDTSFMPKRRSSWASWIYLSETQEDKNESVSLSYWMNNLQNIDPDYPIIVTLNPGREPEPDMIYDEHIFYHPIFTKEAIDAQEKIETIQAIDRVSFCGAYQRYGFHEDGLLSAVKIAKKMNIKIPWETQ